jgi:glycerophosphoryl diester phosphodiesterase
MPPIITSHAACKGHAPENTLPGIRAALKHKADAIEIDVHLTRDAVPVLIHDETVDRTTDGSGPIAAFSLRQARKLDAGNGQSIPTLREVLEEVGGRALVVIEIKPSAIEREVLDAVRRAKALDACAVHSFQPRVVARVRELEPRMPCSLLTGGPAARNREKLFALALSLNAQGVAVHHESVTRDFVRAAHLRELRCSTWTANAQRDVRRLAAAGVDAITSDYPDRVRRWLSKTR